MGTKADTFAHLPVPNRLVIRDSCGIAINYFERASGLPPPVVASTFDPTQCIMPQSFVRLVPFLPDGGKGVN